MLISRMFVLGTGATLALMVVAPLSAQAVDKFPPPKTGTGGSGQTITITVVGTGVKGAPLGSPAVRLRTFDPLAR